MNLLKMPWTLFGKVHIQLEQTNKSEGTLQRPNFSYRGFHCVRIPLSFIDNYY